MKKYLIIAILSLFLVPAMAQEHNCGNCPHHQQHKGQQTSGKSCCSQQAKKTINGLPAEIVKAFPTAKSIKKAEKGTAVYDASKNLLGYAVYSKPASNGIQGFAGETPLMVAISPKDKVLSVTMLDNNETPGYLQKVVSAGLLKAWDGMKVKRAKKANVDCVSGATFSSQSIIATFRAAIKNW